MSQKHSINFYWAHEFGGYLTPQQAYDQDRKLGKNGAGHSLTDYERMAKKIDEECDICGRPIWRMVADLGMCFTCVTGESDASDDYELEPKV